MKTFLKGLFYATSLVVINRLLLYLNSQADTLSLVLFLIAGVGYLASNRTIGKMFGCGFTAMFALLPIDLLIPIDESPLANNWISIYAYGFLGTMAAVFLSCILIKKGIFEKVMTKIEEKRTDKMDEYDVFGKKLKIKLIIYALITAVSFAYLVLSESAGVSVVIFSLLQAVMLFFIVPDKKRLLWCIPLFVMCLNSFISLNTIWRIPNFIICIAIYALMFTPLDIKNVTLRFLVETAERLVAPIITLTKPFEWIYDMTEGKKGYVKRGAIALGISIVSVGVLSVVLSSADMVFSHSVGNMIENFSNIFGIKTIWKILAGAMVGIYLFGIVYNAYVEYDVEPRDVKIKGDVFIISCVMISVLAVYTFFVVIQFKYLFAGSQLPYGLNVTEYARKGFFELLGLTGVNIAGILVVTKLTEHTEGKKAMFIKSMNMYLCAVTVVLLASSFYRMLIYNETDGLTRLRFLVFGFLAFELIGLVITFFYIAKPKFNIVMVYGAIALCYYLVLNLVPMDAIIAKNQVDRYLKGERDELSYVFTLSADAASEMKRAYDKTENQEFKDAALDWVKRKTEKSDDADWRSSNLSEHIARSVYGDM